MGDWPGSSRMVSGFEMHLSSLPQTEHPVGGMTGHLTGVGIVGAGVVRGAGPTSGTESTHPHTSISATDERALQNCGIISPVRPASWSTPHATLG